MRRAGTGAISALALAVTACGSDGPQRINAEGSGAYEISLAAAGDRIVAAWHDTRYGGSDLFLRIIGADGRPAGPEQRLSTGARSESALAFEPSIAALPDDGDAMTVAIGWYQRDPEGRYSARLGLWSDSAGLRWQAGLGTTGAQTRNPVVAAHGEQIFCAWIEHDERGHERVVAGWWDVYGNGIGEPLQVGVAGPTTWNMNAAIGPDGHAWLVYDAGGETRADEIYLATVHGADSATVRLTPDDGADSKYPDIALSDDQLALTWFDQRDGNSEIYLFAGARTALPDLAGSARRVTATSGASIGAYLAWHDGTIGLAWSEASGDSIDVLFGRFDRRAQQIGAIENLSDTRSRALIPAVIPWGTGFAVGWNEVTSATAPGHDPTARSVARLALVP